MADGKTTGTIRVEPDQWGAFQDWCRERHTSHAEELRVFIRERMAGRVVFLSGLKPESMEDIERFADELGVEFEDAVRRILSDFIVQRRQALRDKKR